MSRKLTVILACMFLSICILFAVTAFISLSPAHATYQTSAEPSSVLTPVPGCPPTIASGSTNSYWVRNLQIILNHTSFPNSPYNYHPPLAQDGQFGPLTKNAVMDYQASRHLAVDGIVGPQTWRSLGMCA